MRPLLLLSLAFAIACVDTGPDLDDEGQNSGGSAAEAPTCTGTCSTHFDGSTTLEDLCGLQGVNTDGFGTLHCDEGSSCNTLKTLHRCMNDLCYESCPPKAPTMPSAECHECIENECGGDLSACLADVP